MEHYSKAFWRACIGIHPMHLSQDVGPACAKHCEFIAKWCDGERLERSEQVDVWEPDVWEPVPKIHHRFMHQYKYRVAPPPNVERDVVVFYRDAYKLGPYEKPAGMDICMLWPEGTGDKAKTLADLELEIAGFKLLSITRVVVDPTNRNLLEYSTKLDNLGRVPF